VNVLGLAELVSMLQRRAVLRDGPAGDPARTALEGLVAWSYDLLHGDEKMLLQLLAVHRGGASLASLVATAATCGLNEATVAYLVGALVDKSIVSASFSGGVARYDMLDTVRSYVLERLAASGELAAARRAHAGYFAAVADEARVELRGPQWLPWERRLERENDNLWAALAYARDAPDPTIAALLGTLGWHFGLAGRVSEGRRYLDDALSATHEDAPVELQVELLANLCYLATEESDLEAALAAGERALSLATAATPPRQLGLARLTLAFALAQAGREERVDALARDAAAALEAAHDDWGVAASSIIRATGAARVGDVSTVAALAAVVRRHSDAIGYDAFRVPGLLLEAWVAERREQGASAEEVYRRALELAERVGFDDHAAFALAGLGSSALARGELRESEELLGQALAASEAARAAFVAAHVRVQLGRTSALGGDAATAERLYREVLEWSQTPRPRQARESLFLALAGNPATAALVGVAEIAEVRGDAAAADALRGRARSALT
jgi:tetratricopeptide (TPR) repeat protein